MHRLRRPLKLNIPYNKKTLFKRRLRSYVQPPFLLLRFKSKLLFYSCRFPSHSLP